MGSIKERIASVESTDRAATIESAASAAPTSPSASTSSARAASSSEAARPEARRMTVKWWKRWPSRLKFEFRELKRAGFAVHHDRETLKIGVVCLHVNGRIGDQVVHLRVVFPDLYPYFRFEIEAAEVTLPLHQHPQSKYLCLLGRSTHNWDANDTVAWALREQVPKVFEAALAPEPSAVAQLEEHQAEPFSDYYQYSNSMIMIDSRWQVPKNEIAGTLRIALAGDTREPNDMFVRGAIAEVRGKSGQTLFKCDRAMLQAFPGKIVHGHWVRASGPIREFDAKTFFDRVQQQAGVARLNPPLPLADGRTQILGVVFPEEIGHRNVGEGWVFVCRYERTVPSPGL